MCLDLLAYVKPHELVLDLVANIKQFASLGGFLFGYDQGASYSLPFRLILLNVIIR